MSAIGLIGGLNMDHDIWFYQNLIHTIEEISENNPAIYLFGGDERYLQQCQAQDDYASLEDYYSKTVITAFHTGVDRLIIINDLMHSKLPKITVGVGVPVISLTDAIQAFARKEQIKRMAVLCHHAPDLYSHYQGVRGCHMELCSREEAAELNTQFSGSPNLFDESHTSVHIMHDILSRCRQDGVKHVLLTSPELVYLLPEDTDDLAIYCSDEIHMQYAAEACLACMQQDVSTSHNVRAR